MSESETRTQVLGREGETCRGCAAPLATDQRYCLNCGVRRGEPRLDFRQHLSSAGGTAAGATPNGRRPAQDQAAAGGSSPPQDGRPQRDYTPLAAVGGIAVLGLMLLVGVLIGKGDSGGTAPAPAPVVVQGGEAESSESAASEDAPAAQGGSKQAKSKAGGKGGKAVGGGSAGTGNAPVASDEELQQLQEQSPDEYSESSAKLPDEIATPGAAPPTDGKAPGGGSEGTAIE